MTDDRPIGVFDSGVGGLTILREIEKQLPHENLLYFADSGHCPYGARTLSDIRELTHAIAAFLIDRGAKLIVVACNTASVASLSQLRASFPVPFVGIVPAVKPAAASTQSKFIGVVATQATFQGAIFDDLVEKFAQGVAVVRQVCPGWVELVEEGRVVGPDAEAAVRACIQPLIEQQVDTIVLGCTHYPFLRPVIERLVGPAINIIDPAPAIARQTERVIDEKGLRSSSSGTGSVRYFTSGDEAVLERAISTLLGREGVSIERVALDVPR